jgi:hypothetical protein
MNKPLEEIRFGVEIEVEFPKAKDSYELIQRNKVIPGWRMDFDGSLDNGAEYKATNKNKLYYNEESLTQIKEIIALIKVHHGNIRPSCGLHIHVDMKDFTDKEIINIVKAFYKKQKSIIKKFKVLKYRLQEQSMTPKGVLKLNTKILNDIRKDKASKYDEDYFYTRYYLLNITSLNEFNTLEFRLFNGTIQHKKIKEYVRWVLKFCIDNAR